MRVMDKTNISLSGEIYKFKTVNSYINAGIHTKMAEFDLYFRRLTDGFGYAVFSGLEQVCEYLESLRYGDAELDFLTGTGEFDRSLSDYLKNFRFSGTVKSVPEGSVVFAYEPVMTVRAPLAEAALIETALLQIIGCQTLAATRADRMVSAAHGLPVIEMSARRASNSTAAVFAARAAYIGGAAATTCTIAGQRLGIPLTSVMPHSFVQSFESEYAAFERWIEDSLGPTVLTLDTYDTVSSGTDNAIRAILASRARKSSDVSVRIDSGDIAYLSSRVREKLDRAGLESVKIMASGGLDEYKVRALLRDGAPIDCFGAGGVITSCETALDTAYSLAALEEDGIMKPVIKLGESSRQTTLPGVKKLLRFYDRRSGKAIADEICLSDERVPTSRHTVFDPTATWKTKELVNFEVKEMLETVIENGERVVPARELREIRSYHARELDTLCSDIRKLDSPESYYVDLSEKLWTLRRRMIGAKRSAFFTR